MAANLTASVAHICRADGATVATGFTLRPGTPPVPGRFFENELADGTLKT